MDESLPILKEQTISKLRHYRSVQGHSYTNTSRTGFIKTIHNIPGTVIGSFILIEGYKEIFIQ